MHSTQSTIAARIASQIIDMYPIHPNIAAHIANQLIDEKVRDAETRRVARTGR